MPGLLFGDAAQRLTWRFTRPSPRQISFLLTLGSLLLIVLQAGSTRVEAAALAALTVSSILLAALPVRLAGSPLPLSLLPLTLNATWLISGAPLAAVLALLASLAGPRLTHAAADSRLEARAQLTAVALGGATGGLIGLLSSGSVAHDLGCAVGFGLGYWGGERLVNRLSPDTTPARQGGAVGLLTAVVLAPPALFLDQIERSGDWVIFLASLIVAVGLALLVRATTNGDARNADLAAEIALNAGARRHLELIVDQAPEAIVGVDDGGRVAWVNRTAADWLGERARGAVGQPAGSLFRAHGADGALLSFDAELSRSAASGRPVHEEGFLEAESDAPRHVLLSFSTLPGTPGQIILLRDASVITEGLREQEELAVHLSHELRAPLTTILGYAQLISGAIAVPPGASTSADFARKISESGDYMLRLINNLLDLGKLANGEERPLPTAPIDLLDLSRRIIADQQRQAAARAHTLTFNGPEAPLVMDTSDLAIRQILTNLVGNAIKYTPPGGTIRVVLGSSAEGAVWTVRDNGIGLTPDEQAKLFTRFFRSARPEARLSKGTGLGLALSRTLVEKLGGNISVQSALEQGSTFTVTLPFNTPAR